MKRLTVPLLITLVLVGFALPVVAEEEDLDLITMPHLGGTLAVNVEVVDTVFFLEKDGRARFHLVWKGNSEGKTVEGAAAAEIWKKVRLEWDDEFIWVSHMGGSLGIANDAITSVFFMPAKEGKPATLRINYGGEFKTIDGSDAEAAWKSLAK